MSKRRMYSKRLGSSVAESARPVKSRKFHVVTGEGEKWSVVADGNSRATKVFSTKGGAIRFAKEIAVKISGEVIIHKYSGEVEERVSLAKQ